MSLDVQGSGPSSSYMASDMRAAYYGGTALTGRGQTLALIQFDGYDILDVISAFNGRATLGMSGVDPVVNYNPPGSQTTYSIPVHNVLLDQATGAPGQFQTPADDGEQVLDIVQSIGMAPGLSQVRVYIGNSDVDVLSAIASENLANEVSISWTWYPDDPSAIDPLFEEMAAQGQSVFVASGDYGAYSPLAPWYFPAEDQWVTAAGGTHLKTDGPGGPILVETAWNQSGGGVSPDAIPMPNWQAGIATSSNQASATLRNVPDVAMEADFDNYNCSMGQCSGGWAGTSFASPRWAAFTALVNEQALANGDPKVGFLNPDLYTTGLGPEYGGQYHDVVSGKNEFEAGYGFYAIPGFDLATGWGSPVGQNLIDALAPQSGAAGFELTTTESGVTINPGSTATTTIGVIEVGGFSGNVSLAVTSPLPSGVTASFSANRTNGTSVLTLTTTIFTVAETFNVTVTGVSGAAQATTYLSVDIPTNAVVVLSPAVPAVPVIAELLKPSTQIAVSATVVGQPQAIRMSWASGINATSGWSTAGISLNSSLAPPYSNAAIGTWDTSSIAKAGYYTIQVSATYAEGTVSGLTLVYLEPDLVSTNWPKLLDVTPGSSSGIVPVDRSNGRAGGLAFVEPHYGNLTNLAVYRIFSSDGSSDQSMTLSYGTYFSPSFGPLAPGKSSEAVVADGRTLYAVDNNFTLYPFLPSSVLNADLNFSATVLADLKGNSTLATVTYGIQSWLKTAYVIALGSDGQPLNANFPIQVPYQSIWDENGVNQGVIVGDIDGDGNQEIIALESLEDSTFTLGLFANDGSPLVWNAPTFAGFPGQMILVDLDGNGKLETVIVVSAPITGDITLHVLEPDGSERNGWPIALTIYNALLAAGDLARTGTEQIVASSGDKLFVLNGDGSSFSSAWPLTTNPFDPFSQPVLADIDGDGYPEILVTHANYSFPQDSGKLTTTAPSPVRTGSGKTALTTTQVNLDSISIPAYFAPVLQAFHRDGTVARSWNILGMNGEQPSYDPHVTVGDFNHEGMTDIAVVNGLISGGGANGFVIQGVVEVLSTGSPFNPTANDWPMMDHDPHNGAVAYPTGAHSPRAESPVFGTSSGAYLTTQTVVVTDATPNATIYYTVDGSTPTTGSIEYSGPITVSSSETIKAIAVSTGYSQSLVVPAAYTINLPAAAPTFSITPGTYTSVQTVAISDSTPAATIYYTTDGTTPTTGSSIYSGPISVSSTETIEAIAVASGYSQSPVSTAVYTVTPPAAAPVFSPAQGTYTSMQPVSISDSMPGAAIYYTTNGTMPTTSSTLYSSPITVSSTETIEAIAVASGYSQSPVSTAVYTINLPAATPAFSVTPGTYTSVQTVSISDTTPSAVIYYTTNGSTPTTSSTPYSGAITVTSTETIQAIANASGYSTSAVASAAYTINIPTNPVPVIRNISPGFTSAGGSALTLAINGSGFTTSSTAYSGTSALVTQYLSATQLTAQVTAADITSVGATAITVQTPSLGGGTSNSFKFEVDSSGSGTTAPTITSATATVAAGSTANYPVILPSTVTTATATCLNLPTGATCNYSSSTSTVTITTSSTTPAGAYQVTVVFSETVSGAATAGILLPFLLLPLMLMRKRLATRGIWTTACLGLVLIAAAALSTGCGGGGSPSTTPPPTNQTHQITTSGLVTLTIQ